ncbi:MAG: GumC family protein [Bacteroidales bacterium]
MLERNQGGINETPSVAEEEINLVEVVMKYVCYWKWILASVLLFVGLGFFYLQTKNKIYQVSTTVLLNDEKGNARSDLGVFQEMGILSGAGANVENEMEVMRSKDLMSGVVRELQLYTKIHEKRGLRRVNLYKQSPIAVEVAPEVVEHLPGALTFVLKKTGENQYSVKGRIGEVAFARTFDSFPYDLSLPQGRVMLRTTPFHQEKAWTSLEIAVVDPADVATTLSESVDFAMVKKNGSIVRLSMRTDNTAEGKDILAKVIENYNEETITSRNETAMSTERFINDRLVLLQKELASVEKNVEGYKKSNKLTNIEAESGLFIEQTGEVDKQRADIETQLNILSYIDEFVKKPENLFRIVPNIGITDAGLLKVIDEYNKLLLTRERTLRTTSEDNPTIRSINGDISSMRASILGGIEVVNRSLSIAQKDIAKKGNNISQRIKEVPRQERELLEIMRQQKIKDALYMFLLEKKEENLLSMTMTVPMARLIEKPYTGKQPVAPRSLVILMASLLLGVIVPVVAIFVKELLNVTIENRHELAKLTKLPVLGEINHEEIKRSVCTIHENNTSLSNELFRNVRNNLLFISGMDHKKIITVTSNIPGEGKTFVSSNVAAVFSITGKRVALVGLDLRNPQLANVFGLENKGITNYLSGQENDWKTLIQQVPEYPNLDILPAGPVSLNPNEMLMSKKLKQLMADLRNAYDYVIVDSAPVGVVSDTYLLNELSDLFVFVCRANYTNRKLIGEVDVMVAESKIKNAYFLVNDVDMRSKGYGYGKYTYGYHGSDEKKKKKKSESA